MGKQNKLEEEVEEGIPKEKLIEAGALSINVADYLLDFSKLA